MDVPTDVAHAKVCVPDLEMLQHTSEMGTPLTFHAVGDRSVGLAYYSVRKFKPPTKGRVSGVGPMCLPERMSQRFKIQQAGPRERRGRASGERAVGRAEVVDGCFS